MSSGDTQPAAARAGAEFDKHEGRCDGAKIAAGLAQGITRLRDSMLRRILKPDKPLAQDSMLLPVSELKARQEASEEVEAFIVAESTVGASRYNLVSDAEGWYCGWLTAMRLQFWNPLSDVSGRVKEHLRRSADERRLEFSNILVQAIPESRQAPLVLFRLVPTAVHLATVQAFGKSDAAEKVRREQIKILPGISYCRKCHGRVLEVGEECSACGNPFWNQELLCSFD